MSLFPEGTLPSPSGIIVFQSDGTSLVLHRTEDGLWIDDNGKEYQIDYRRDEVKDGD